MHYTRLNMALIILSCATLGWLAIEALAAGNGSTCPMTLDYPSSAPSPGCPQEECSGTNTICLNTQPPATLGATAIEWGWSGTAWIETGGTINIAEAQEVHICRCGDYSGEGIEWVEDEKICCKLVWIKDGVGRDRVATMGECDNGDDCDKDGKCSVVLAPGGVAGPDASIQSSCE